MHGFIIARDPLRFYSSDHEILNTGSQLLMSEKYLDKRFQCCITLVRWFNFCMMAIIYIATLAMAWGSGTEAKDAFTCS